jgi:phage shock protein C
MNRLYLSSNDKKLAGICGGIAEFMEVDSTIVRLLAVILALITAVVPFCLAYIIAWIIVPHKPRNGKLLIANTPSPLRKQRTPHIAA